MDPALPTVVRRPPPSLSPTRRGARGGSVACRARLAPAKPTVASARHNGPRLPRHRQYPGSSPPPRFPASAASSSEEHTSELQSLMRTSYAVFCLKKNNDKQKPNINHPTFKHKRT